MLHRIFDKIHLYSLKKLLIFIVMSKYVLVQGVTEFTLTSDQFWTLHWTVLPVPSSWFLFTWIPVADFTKEVIQFNPT